MCLTSEHALGHYVAVTAVSVPPGLRARAAALQNPHSHFPPDESQILSSSSLTDFSQKSGSYDAAKAKGGSRLYRMANTNTRSLWLKIQVLSPLLLMDMALPLMHPASLPRMTWDIVMLVVVLYVAVVTPLKISFPEATHLLILHVVDLVATACLSVDVIVNLRTAYISPIGELVRDSRLIASRYIRGMFLLDVAAAIPFNVILHKHDQVTPWLALLKLIPLLRLVRLMKGSGHVGSLLAMGRLIIFMLLVAHWACCFWHYLSEAIPEWPWMFTVRCTACSASLQYLMGFYSAFLLLLGDKPDTHNNLERAVVTGLLFLGALLYAVVVGSMSLLVASMFAAASRHRQRAAMLDDALRYRGVNEDVRDQVGEYFAYLAQFQHPGTDGVAFLQELPVGLYGDVMGTMFGPRLSRVQLFMHCERPFLWRLSQRLRLSLHMSGDIIYDVGSVGHDMYIIWKGAVALVDQDGGMIALLCDGDHFGERGVMAASAPRPHKAVALKPSDVMVLSRWDIQDAMKDFPESAALVKYRARTRLEDHETHGNSLWVFLAAWEQILAQQADATGFMAADGSTVLKSPAVLRRRQRQQAATMAMVATADVQQQATSCQFTLPPNRVNGSGCDVSVRAFGGSRYRGPIAEALDVVPASFVTTYRSISATTEAASAVVVAAAGVAGSLAVAAAQAKPTSRGIRGAISGLGARVTNLMRRNNGRGQKGEENNVAANEFTEREEDYPCNLAASPALSMRTSSCAVLQALVMQGQTLTAAQRRMVAAPSTQSSSGADGMQQGQQDSSNKSMQCSRAGGSLDDMWPGGLRPARPHAMLPGTMQPLPPSAAASSSSKLTRQRSLQFHPLWVESMRLEEFSDDGSGGNEADTKPSPKRRQHGEVCRPTSCQHGRQRHGRLTGGALPMRPSLTMSQQQADMVLNPGTSEIQKRSQTAPRNSCCLTPLPHQVQLRQAGVPDGMQEQQQQQAPSQQQLRRLPKEVLEAPVLPTLEEVWRRIQKAAGTGGASGNQGAGRHGLPKPSSSLQDLQIQRPLSLEKQLLRDEHGSLVLVNSAMPVPAESRYDSIDSRQPTADGFQSPFPPCQPPPRATSASTVQAASQPQVTQSSSGSTRQGSTASTFPKLLSQGYDEGMGAMLAPSQSLPPGALLHTRPIVGSAFATFAPPGLLSPMNCSPRNSATGFLPSVPLGRQLGSRSILELPGGGGVGGQPQSPPPNRLLRQSSRLLAHTTSFGRSRYPSHSTRQNRSSTGYTVTSVSGGGCSGVVSDGRTSRGGFVDSDGAVGSGGDGSDDGSWSSDSSDGGSRRLVVSLRSQLSQANARIILLETQIADMNRDPLKVPTVAAVVQREVRAALDKMGIVVNSRLSELIELLAQMSVRAENLSQVIAATDERLQHLEDEPGVAFHDLPKATAAAGAAGMSMGAAVTGAPTGGVGSGGGVGSSSGIGSGSGKLHQSSHQGIPLSTGLSREGILMARHSASGLPTAGGLAPLHLSAVESMSRGSLYFGDLESGSPEWHRSPTATVGAGAGGSGWQTGHGSKRGIGTRLGTILQGAPHQGIL
ncbi:hypothetical protein VaNZ11_002496, partial [Volvox africanus]